MKTAMQELIDWAGTELKLSGYEHQTVIDKAIELRNYAEREDVKRFFLWFRANGELHIGKSIEHLIEVFYSETYP